MSEIKHDVQQVVQWVKDAYMLGFNASGTSFNAEVPFKGGPFEEDEFWKKLRDIDLQETYEEIGANE